MKIDDEWWEIEIAYFTKLSISVRSGPPSASKRDPLVLRFERVDV